MEALVAWGVDVDYEIPHMGTPLYSACRCKEFICARMLLDGGKHGKIHTSCVDKQQFYDNLTMSNSFFNFSGESECQYIYMDNAESKCKVEFSKRVMLI